MRNVILSLPRCGSAWLAAYFGYLHDPLSNLMWDRIKAYSIVDTGAAIDPLMAYRKYGADNTVVLVGNTDRVKTSLNTLGFPVGGELVEEWNDRLHRLALGEDLPIFEYSDLLGCTYNRDEVHRLCDALEEDYDSLRWTNQMELKVQHNLSEYSRPGYENYVRWLRAP